MERVGGWRVFTFLVLVQLVKLQPTEIRVGTALSLNLCAKWEEAVLGSNTTLGFSGYISLGKLLILATSHSYVSLKLNSCHGLRIYS